MSDDDAEIRQMLPDGVRFIPVPMKRGISLGGFKATAQMRKIFKREKFDLVQYSTPNAALYASIAAKRAKVPVRNYHLMGLRYLGGVGLGRWMLKTLEKISCKNSTHIECVSPSNLEMSIQEKIFDKDKATVVWNGSSCGVDLQRFAIEKREEWREEQRTKYGFQNTDFVFGFVGRITKDKGINELILAFDNVKKEMPCKLVLIGRIDTNHGLSQEVLKKIEGDDVLHIPQTSEIEKYYPMLDALVLPSYREGFGNVVIEAEAMGVPVLVSNIPGPTDAMVDGKTGFVFECKNVQALQQAMQKLMQADIQNLSHQATEFVQTHFDEQTILKHILQRKQQLLGLEKTEQVDN